LKKKPSDYMRDMLDACQDSGRRRQSAALISENWRVTAEAQSESGVRKPHSAVRRSDLTVELMLRWPAVLLEARGP
jgi:hypothetical protein